MYRYLERLQKSRLSRFTFRSIAFSILLLSLSLLALRGFSALLEDNPVWVNKLLEKYNATTNSPSVRWRYIDPIVEMETFVFGAGSIQKFKLELDLIESIFRATPVPKKVMWEKLSLDFIYAEKSGWQIKNLKSLQLPFDLTKSLRNADSLEGYIELRFIDGDTLADAIGIDVRSVNSDREHLNSISFRNVKHGRESFKLKSYEKITPWGLREDFFSASGSISLSDTITKGPKLRFLLTIGGCLIGLVRQKLFLQARALWLLRQVLARNPKMSSALLLKFLFEELETISRGRLQNFS